MQIDIITEIQNIGF